MKLSVTKRLEAIGRSGFVVCISYGPCQCKDHLGSPGYGISLHTQEGESVTEVFPARSLENCLDIADREVAKLKRTVN